MEFTGDPRKDRRHRERGPKRFTFTFEDLARITGLSVRTVRGYACRRWVGSGEPGGGHYVPGKLNPSSLESVVAFVASRGRKSPPGAK